MHSFMRLLLTLTVATVFFAPSATLRCFGQDPLAVAATKADDVGDTNAILGVWKLANQEFIDGKGIAWLEAARKFPSLEWDFAAETLTLDKTTKLRYRIDLTQQPHAIDIAGLDRKNPEAFVPGIFKLEGTKLTVCLCRFQDRERPKGFSPQLPAAHLYEFVR